MFKPLLALLNIDHSALENFEALLALTNLASGNEDELRSRLLREPGAFGLIEHYLFEESHEMLRRAAAECVCNLVLAEKVCSLASTFYSDLSFTLNILLIFTLPFC